MSRPRKLLLLGGTAEAFALAEAAAGLPELEVITSLAGRTLAPRRPAGGLRLGGFGGGGGLESYLKAQGIDLLLDATHPFAAQISQQAAEAAERCGVPRLLLLRAPWRPQAGDDWRPVADLRVAAAALPEGARVFLAVGRQELAPFALRPDLRILLRLVDPPARPPLPGAEVVVGRGPFAEDDERALLESHGIELLVTKNSGGAGAYPKLAAARALKLPVVMVERPAKPPGPRAENVEEALAWVAQRLA